MIVLKRSNNNNYKKYRGRKLYINDYKIDIEEEYINKDNKLKRIQYITGSISVILIFILLIKLFIPSITFNNSDVISYNDTFDYNKYNAKNVFKNYKDRVKINGKVNKKLGDYELIYSLKFGILKVKKKRIIKVIDDIKPDISLEGNNEVIVCPNKEYKEDGYKAIDGYDGDLTDKVKIKKIEDKIIYSIRDSSGNESKIDRKIKYEDKEKPIITLSGNKDITIYVGDNYSELGYEAFDNCDGDLTDKVEIIGNVNTNKIGTYIITYRVKDNNQNEVSITRTIKVEEKKIIRPSNGGNGKGIIYLTFDDGPNEGTTNVILDILKEERVEATFFVTCNGPDYLIKRMYDEGHTVALHTATHDYSYIYSSDTNYFVDLNRVSDRVERITGTKSMIIRFPGGSSNTISRRYNSGIMTRLTAEVKRQGYHYFDWNVDSNDAAGANINGVYNNVVNNISLNRENVVLMHDVKTATRDAIRNIIKYGKNNGFTFKKINNDTVMVTHGVNN